MEPLTSVLIFPAQHLQDDHPFFLSFFPNICLWTYGHFELPPFPEVAALDSELRLFGGRRYRVMGSQLLVSLSSVCLQTRFALHLFALLCYTL
jgi:hypothetical protein